MDIIDDGRKKWTRTPIKRGPSLFPENSSAPPGEIFFPCFGIRPVCHPPLREPITCLLRVHHNRALKYARRLSGSTSGCFRVSYSIVCLNVLSSYEVPDHGRIDLFSPLHDSIILTSGILSISTFYQKILCCTTNNGR